MRVHLPDRSSLLALAILMLCSVPVPGAAQIVNPSAVEFSASPDHATLESDGTARLTSYELRFYQQGAAAPFQVASLGKPTPAADGTIRIPFSTVTVPSAGIVYEARVAALGPVGSATSTVSNTFTFAAPCTYAAVASVQAFTAVGGSGTVTVTAPGGCAWTAVSGNTAWLTVTFGATGSGNGLVSFAAARNTNPSARSAVLTVAGRAVTVTQAAASACTTVLTPATRSIEDAGGTFALAVATGTGCAWTAVSHASWLTIVSGASGNGAGTVTVRAAANPATTARHGTLTIGGVVATITQTADALIPKAPNGFHIVTQQ